MPTQLYSGTPSFSSSTACFIAESAFGAAAIAELIAVASPLRSMSVIFFRRALPVGLRYTVACARPLRAGRSLAARSRSCLQLPVNKGQAAEQRHELQRRREPVQPPELDAARIVLRQARRRHVDLALDGANPSRDRNPRVRGRREHDRCRGGTPCEPTRTRAEDRAGDQRPEQQDAGAVTDQRE